MRSLSFVVAGFLITTFSQAALAGGIDEIRAGASIQSVSGIADNLEDGVALSGEIIFDSPKPLKWLFNARPHLGASVALDEAATSYGYAGLTWRLRAPMSRFYFDAGVGGAVHNGETSFDPAIHIPRPDSAFLGCRGLFRLHATPGVRILPRTTLSIQYEHLSNAGICDENEGLDNLGVRLGVRF